MRKAVIAAVILAAIAVACAVAALVILTSSVRTVPAPAPVISHSVTPAAPSGPATLEGCMDYVLPTLTEQYPDLPLSTLRSEAATACEGVLDDH